MGGALVLTIIMCSPLGRDTGLELPIVGKVFDVNGLKDAGQICTVAEAIGSLGSNIMEIVRDSEIKIMILGSKR
ncbi:1798_t:CDS:2 [Funneliformis geosporum]|uniref:1798_t:CDS:1 n=1 Tax=Funneliformis geosporum TaxID=1117311 RepID=A0A9W4SE66_9GLOM|nr:1798_t:CDS:2 [Funneliformis geosporum]